MLKTYNIVTGVLLVILLFLMAIWNPEYVVKKATELSMVNNECKIVASGVTPNNCNDNK